MGGDFGPKVTVPASLQVLKKHPNISIKLVGIKEKILKELNAYDAKNHERLVIHESTQIVMMDESPQSALKNKKDSWFK